MYNNEIKTMYLDSRIDEITDRTKVNILNTFAKTEAFEKIYDRDASCWNVDEILTFYKSLGTSSENFIISINSYLRLYTMYCIVNNLVDDNQNHYDEITREMIIACVNKTKLDNSIITRKQLLSIISKISNPCDRFLLLGTFEGISGYQMEDMLHASINDIDGNTMKLHSGKIIEISDELKQLAYLSAGIYEYITTNTRIQTCKLTGTTDQIIKEKSIYRECGSKERRFQQVMRNLKIENSEIPKTLTLKKIYINGMIDFINRKSREKGISAKQYLKTKKYREEFELQYKPIDSAVTFIKKYDKYLE